MKIKLSLKNQTNASLSVREFETAAGLLYAEAIGKVPGIEKEKYNIRFSREDNEVIMDLSDLSDELKQQLVDAGYVAG